LLTEMLPAQVHMQVDTSFRAGLFSIRTVAHPGVHGDVVTGTQGWGVRTPWAAEVAEATWGLASDRHIPKVGMFVIGTKSWIVPAGWFMHVTLIVDDANVAGAAPKVHVIVAPVITSLAIYLTSKSERRRSVGLQASGFRLQADGGLAVARHPFGCFPFSCLTPDA